MTTPPDPTPAADTGRGGVARLQARDHARRFLDAYTGEHGIYGVVLVTALVALGEHYDTDVEVLGYVVGTMLVFWLAHLYAGVVAAGGDPARRGESTGAKVLHAARHSAGMLVAMLPPTLLLALGSFGVLDEQDAYDLASATGVVVLAVIGWLNAARNGRRWPLCLVGSLATATLGLLVIGLSTLAH